MIPLTPTEIEELRIAIAEEMGWNFNPSACKNWRSKDRWCMSPAGEMLFKHNIPPYTSSIDAIKAAAMERFKDDVEKCRFQYELDYQYESGGYFQEWQLTALDWCVAFARTAKIWRWKV